MHSGALSWHTDGAVHTDYLLLIVRNVYNNFVFRLEARRFAGGLAGSYARGEEVLVVTVSSGGGYWLSEKSLDEGGGAGQMFRW